MPFLGGFVFVVAGLEFFALWLYALISAIKNERLDPNMRIVWVLVVILVTGLGAVLYLLIAPNRPTGRELALEDAMRRRDELRRGVPPHV
jgi:hypothetical protein